MSRTARLYLKQSISYGEMRAFILEHNGQEVNPTRGGKYSFNAYSLEGGYITVELFPDFEPEIWEELDEREIAQIQEKLGGIPIMCVELELSPDLGLR